MSFSPNVDMQLLTTSSLVSLRNFSSKALTATTLAFKDVLVAVRAFTGKLLCRGVISSVNARMVWH